MVSPLAPSYARHEIIDKRIALEESLQEAKDSLQDMQIQEIDLGYVPREFQKVLHASMRRFNVLVCHRRFGKTVFCIMELVDRGLTCKHRNPQVAYIAPTYAQAKRVAWQYILDFTRKFPGVIVNKSELSVTLPRPHMDDHVTIWLLGADNPDSLRGIYLDWCVLDEYAQCHPMIWGEIIRPALSDRKGGAIFIGTPKGQNHFHKIFRAAQGLMDDGNPNWFAQMYKASQTGVVDEEELMDARATMTEEEYAQEYECSFTAALLGSYYGRYLAELDKKSRICDFDYDTSAAVRTYWDLGISDTTAIWFVQSVGSEIRIIDYLENSGVGLEWYVKAVRDKPYIYDHVGHGIPHDGAARELGTGKSRQETLRELGLLSHVVPRQSIADGIHAVRTLMQKNLWIHATKCAKGIEALRNYQRKWDGKNSMFVDKPLHNWASDAADAFRYLALDLDLPNERIDFRNLQRIKHNTEYNELEF